MAKRFRLTAKGKVVRSKPGRRHLLECKSAGRKRRLAKQTLVDERDAPRIKECLPFG